MADSRRGIVAYNNAASLPDHRMSKSYLLGRLIWNLKTTRAGIAIAFFTRAIIEALVNLGGLDVEIKITS
jgi:hypothetical protein